MLSTLLALCVSATPQSPASFSAMSFYDEAFVQSREDEKLGDWGWPTLEFPSRGVVVTNDGEVERFTFTAKATESGFVLTLKSADGRTLVRFWRWLDADRAATDLWFGQERIASRKRPGPAERRDAYGDALAARALTGSFSDSRGRVFAMQADGGVQWGTAGRGTFFHCVLECTPTASEHLCLRIPSRSQEYVFEETDAGTVARPIQSYDACGARMVVDGGVLKSTTRPAGQVAPK